MLLILIALIATIGYVWFSFALGHMFEKLGQRHWEAWVPVYNMMVLARVAGYPPSLGLISLTGIGGIVLLFLAGHRLNRMFQAPSWFTVLAGVVPPVWASILGFGSYSWNAAQQRDGGVQQQGEYGFSELGAGLQQAPANSESSLPLSPPPPPPPHVFEQESSVLRSEQAPASGHAHEQWSPRHAWQHEEQSAEVEEQNLEVSVEVSAVVAAPVAGVPRSAFRSVAVEYEKKQEDEQDQLEMTEISSRKQPRWNLLLPDGEVVVMTSDCALLGRQPRPVHTGLLEQLITVNDSTRTVSKVHARVELIDGKWLITDLDSTNGVVLLTEENGEVEIATGTATPLTERFLLGDAELRMKHGT